MAALAAALSRRAFGAVAPHTPAAAAAAMAAAASAVTSSATTTVISPPTITATVARRHMGLLDRLRAGVTEGFKDKAEEKKREMFALQLDFLATSPTYTMFDHVGVLKRMQEAAGAGGWKAALRTAAQQAEIDEAFVDVRIGEALSGEEAGDPASVRRREKLRIAGAAGVEVARVNKFMDGYDQSKMVHAWIQGRKARGLPLPATMEDYYTLMIADKVGLKDRKAAMNAQMGNVRNQRAMLRRM